MASLLQQNPWLRDPKTREKAMRIAAASSSAVEGIRRPFAASGQAVTGARRKNASAPDSDVVVSRRPALHRG